MTSPEKQSIIAVLIVAIVAVVAILAPMLQRTCGTGSDYLSSIASLVTAFAAIGAIVIAIRSEVRTEERFERSENRAQQRFEQGNRIQLMIAAASVKPTLVVHHKMHHKSNDPVEVRLYNEGLGPAKITKLLFTKNGRSAKLIPLVLDGLDFNWLYGGLTGQSLDLGSRDHLPLTELTVNDLKEQGFNDEQIEVRFRRMNEQLKGLMISAEYEDLFENKQQPLEVSLS